MAKRGRTAGFVMTDEHRLKIKNSNILRVLIEHVEGKREMTATQVNAGLGLLRKVMPDLSSVEMKADVETTHYHITDKPMSADEWASAYTVGSAGGASKGTH